MLLVFSHGAHGIDTRSEGCNKKWNEIPESIYRFDGMVINGLEIKTYQLCTGIRNLLKEHEYDLYHDTYRDNGSSTKSLLLKDKNGVLLSDKKQTMTKTLVMKIKLNEFLEAGYSNIIFSGHSAGGWSSLMLKSIMPEAIDGIIVLNPARSGYYAKQKKANKVNQEWEDERAWKISKINVGILGNSLIYSHFEDRFENPETLSFLRKNKSINFVDLTDFDCEGRDYKDGHRITISDCFAKSNAIKNKIIDYLKSINF